MAGSPAGSRNSWPRFRDRLTAGIGNDQGRRTPGRPGEGLSPNLGGLSHGRQRGGVGIVGERFPRSIRLPGREVGTDAGRAGRRGPRSRHQGQGRHRGDASGAGLLSQLCRCPDRGRWTVSNSNRRARRARWSAGRRIRGTVSIRFNGPRGGDRPAGSGSIRRYRRDEERPDPPDRDVELAARPGRRNRQQPTWLTTRHVAGAPVGQPDGA